MTSEDNNDQTMSITAFKKLSTTKPKRNKVDWDEVLNHFDDGKVHSMIEFVKHCTTKYNVNDYRPRQKLHALSESDDNDLQLRYDNKGHGQFMIAK